jgi:hypothetical protein
MQVRRWCFRTGGILPALVLGATSASALINPNFTPRELLNESTRIVIVTVAKGAGEGTYVASVQSVLKGDAEPKELTLDFSAAITPESGEMVATLVKRVDGSPCLFFVGEYASDTMGAGAGTGGGGTKGFLSVEGKWASFSYTEGKPWLLDEIDSHMQATWAGGTDMLIRAMKYGIADTLADYPVVGGSQWNAPAEVSKIAGLARLRPVDLEGNGKWRLFASSTDGDRIYSFDSASRAHKDETAERKLSSKSKAATWADFDGSGLLDLASFDGNSVSLFMLQADGTFLERGVKCAIPLASCMNLAVVDAGGKAAIVVGGDSIVLIKDPASDSPATEQLKADSSLRANLGEAGECLVADLDGDANPDVLQLFARGSLLFKGKGQGAFTEAVACPIMFGKGGKSACVGDYDADGRLDVLVAGEMSEMVWQNEGDGNFKEYISLCGELAYISKPGGVDCGTCDFNNDGRQDVFLAYVDTGAQLFFNRGFRSFGHAHDMDLTENGLLKPAEQGQRTGCVADFDGDGAQDMALGLFDGSVWVFFNVLGDQRPRSVTAALPLKDGNRGPVSVAGAAGNRSLGAWNVIPGLQDAFFGISDAGTVDVKWKLPGPVAGGKAVTVKNRPVRIEVK